MRLPALKPGLQDQHVFIPQNPQTKGGLCGQGPCVAEQDRAAVLGDLVQTGKDLAPFDVDRAGDGLVLVLFGGAGVDKG